MPNFLFSRSHLCVCSGGLSNWLYHVKLQKHVNNYTESSPREVMLRLYGQSHGECGIQHLITESVIFALLSERKLGPRLYGVFAGGRIEEYIPVCGMCDAEWTMVIL